MNYKKIPEEIKTRVIERDTKCVYCGRDFSGTIRFEWEHIINDENNVKINNIALCCRSCNRSKGNKKLSDWIYAKTPYRMKFVNITSLSDIIKDLL